ncbi:hypothetical protein DMH04_24420 [Kibdelosporangium aridum]|uniref:Uncharacterized protein n=1 Tax=Kibdelosporangium aridum TaxID=2030 RepID=A0A428Z6E6_KIBAR|nr:hypothetical protein [Kibdelosporangium aridum]RSM82766.1 hypothetical protein DMH04_24420 [Kibdelosporangium aridum]
MQCTVRRPLPLLSWVALPVLFTAVVLGLTSVGQLLLASPGDTVLTSAHMGTAAGVTAMVGYSIEWPPGWRWLNWPYAFVVFVAGIVLHGMVVPAILAIGLGIPSAALLLRITWLHRGIGKHAALPS